MLEENWLFHIGDDSTWANPDYNDSDWITVDSRLKRQDYKELDYNGLAWLRLHLQLDSSLMHQPMAIMVRQQGASEIYVNGKLLTSYGTVSANRDSTLYYNPQYRPQVLPFDSAGKYVIAVRYVNHNARETGKKYSGVDVGFKMKIDIADDAIFEMRGLLIMMGLFLLILAGLFIALAFVHLTLWFYHKQERSNLYFSIFSLCFALSFFAPYLVYNATNPRLAIWGAYWGVIFSSGLLLSLSGLSNVMFVRSKIRFYIIASLCLLPVAFLFYDVNVSVGIIVFSFIVVIIESIIVTIMAMVRKKRGSRIVGVGVLFFTLFVLTVMIVGIVGGRFQINGSPAGIVMGVLTLSAFLSIPISMSVYLAVDFARMNKDLNAQLENVKELSEKNLAQEREKKHLLETQNERLEKEVAERTSEIVAEKHKSDELLRNILPEEIAEELKQKGSSEARYFDHVTVIFTDFVDFTKAGERLSPQELVDELDTCFKEFDRIISKYDIEKIKTIGDAYLAVSGLPAPDNQHAVHTVQAALEIMEFMQQRRKDYPNKSFDIRIGIHSGAVVAGIVGVKKFAYDIWGDTVNTAARMESSSEANKINISNDTYELVKEHFACTYRGEVAAKNKGDMDMYFVDGKKS